MSPTRHNSNGRSAVVQQKADFSRDISLLLRTASTREQLIIRLLWETGITLKELTSLRKTDLDARARTLLIRPENTKNGLYRTIRLSTQLATTLATHARNEKGDYLFSSRQRPQLTTRRVEQLLANACNKAGITTITARDLRNAYLAAAATTARDNTQLRAITGLKTITKDNALTEKEQQKLARALKKTPVRARALASIILQTGKTLRETIALTRQDIATLTITPGLATQLRTLAKKPGEQLFSTRQSAQITTRRAEQLIKAIGEKANLQLTSNRLRTTALRGGQQP